MLDKMWLNASKKSQLYPKLGKSRRVSKTCSNYDWERDANPSLVGYITVTIPYRFFMQATHDSALENAKSDRHGRHQEKENNSIIESKTFLLVLYSRKINNQP